jgi:hypothetical protein
MFKTDNPGLTTPAIGSPNAVIAGLVPESFQNVVTIRNWQDFSSNFK